MKSHSATSAAVWATVLLLSSSASAQETLNSSQALSLEVGANGGPHGSAAGDLDGDGQLEIVYVIRHGRDDSDDAAAPQGVANKSSLVAYGHKADPDTGELRLELLWQVQPTNDIAGFPTLADFDGDEQDEVAVCELTTFASPGSCRVFDGDGTELPNMRIDNLAYAGMTNGGPSAADLDGDGYHDLVVATNGGEVVMKRGNEETCDPCDGAPTWHYDLWGNHGDWAWGHAAIGDVDGDDNLDIVIGGNGTGAFFALDRNGTLIAESADEYDADAGTGHFYFGAGPSLGDMDEDGDLEVIGLLDYFGAGLNPKIVVYDIDPAKAASDATKVSVVGEELLTASASYTSPVVADIVGDGLPEIIITDNLGALRTFGFDADDPNAATAISQGAFYAQLGDASWSSPALIDTDTDGDVEVLMTTISGAYLFNDSLALIQQWEQAGSNVFPQPVSADGDGDGELEMYLGTWNPAQVVVVDLPYPNTGTWGGLGGGASHDGMIATQGSDVVDTDNPALETAFIVGGIVDLVADPGNCTLRSLRRARNQAERAHRYYLRGEPHLSSDRLRLALIEMQNAHDLPDCDTDYWQERIAYASRLELRQYIDRSTVVFGSGDTDIVDAEDALDAADAQLALGEWLAAAVLIDDASEDLRGALDAGGYPVEGECIAADEEIFQSWMCKAVEVYEFAAGTYDPGIAGCEPGVAGATSALRSYIVWMPDLVFDQSLAFAGTAATALEDECPEMQRLFAEAAMSAVRVYLSNASIWFSDIDPDALATAEAHFANGEALVGQAAAPYNYSTAMTHFFNAYADAQPCANDSFGGNAEGLEGGGCSL